MDSERFMQQHYGANGFVKRDGKFPVEMIRFVREQLVKLDRTDLDTFADLNTICTILSDWERADG